MFRVYNFSSIFSFVFFPSSLLYIVFDAILQRNERRFQFYIKVQHQRNCLLKMFSRECIIMIELFVCERVYVFKKMLVTSCCVYPRCYRKTQLQCKSESEYIHIYFALFVVL